MEFLIKLKSDFLRYREAKILNPHHVTIPRGVTAIMGPNGAGKTMLGNIIEKGWNFCTNSIEGYRERLKIKKIEFADIHSLAGFKVEYYQQRFESMMNDEVPTVAEIFHDRIDTPRWQELTTHLRLNDIATKRINFLSSGETRKLLIVNLLFDLPDVLILDNPYIGLDAASREILNDTIKQIAHQGVSVILLLCNPVDLPPTTDCVIPLRDMTIEKPVTRDGEDIKLFRQRFYHLFDYAINLDDLPVQPAREYNADDTDVVLALSGCKVKYGSRTIIDNVSWVIRNKECWALFGPNGSGKSTLLSLVHADNPQGYSNDITLFDRRRGSGESIWEIKRRIGYISPEMHLYFNGGGDIKTIVAQGLNDTVGLFCQVKPWQMERAMHWLRLLHIEHLAHHRFNTLSAGEQRLALLARTFIKHPQLLILDEPLHGLDAARKRSVRGIINHLVARDKITLIYVTHYLPEVPECVTHTKTLSKN